MNEEIIEVVIRFHSNAVVEFERHNRMTIENLTQILGNLPSVFCVWQHIEEGAHKCFAVLPNNEGQADFWLIWDELTFSYHAQVRGERKSVFKGTSSLPNSDLPQISRNCRIKIVDYAKPARTTEALETLKKRVDNLPLPPKVESDLERTIWDKYIEAQQIVINKLQEPFIITTAYPMRAVTSARGLVSRYQLRLDLLQEENPEQRIIEEEIKKVGIIDQNFDASGNIFLTLDEVENGFDAILRRSPFNEIMARDPAMVAIIKVRPLSATLRLAESIEKLRHWLGDEIEVTVERQHALVHSTSDYKKFLNMLERVNLKIVRYRGVFEILNHGENLIENTEFHEPRFITFGAANNKGTMKFEHLFPEPDGNTFFMIREDLFDIHFFKNTLQHIYGKENVITQVDTIVGIDFDKFNFDMNEDFWNELRRAFYEAPFEMNFGEIDNTIAFEFKTREEFWERWTYIRDMQKCSFTITPDHADFRFKVRTSIISKKTQKQLLLEKIEALGGAEMVLDLPPIRKGDKKKLLVVGKLNARESDTSRLNLYLLNFYEEDKKRTQQFIDYLEQDEHPTIRSIRANLTGEAAKVRWLREAMLKLTDPSELRVNGTPVNPKLGTFLFDSSKASIVEYKEIERKSALNDLKKNELLRLNESQRMAVFKSLNAPDLCLLQGPPGTGKTTVIAEIIWQLIRRDQKHRVLLTSETNLAVDNAIERLLNVKHLNPALSNAATLIKPLRFGRLEKFEEEGKRYSVDRIMRWIDEHYKTELEYENELDTEEIDETTEDILRDNPDNNVVYDWMLKIANRVTHQDEKYGNILRDWTTMLAMPDKTVKSIFKDKYFKFANVIGSTCSSCGSPAFANGYRDVFYGEKDPDAVRKVGEILFLIRDRPNSQKIWQLLGELDIKVENGEDSDLNAIKTQLIKRYSIHFDSVIMDEASKATPPELVLPLCFAQKAIVIGDHRQLPPMIHEKDFVEALTDVGAGGMAQLLDPHYVGTSQFARLITNPKLHETVRATFNVQYRMHPHINDVIKQFYTEDGGLTCGLDDLKVDSPNLNDPQSRFHGFFHKDFINKDLHVIWVDVKDAELQDGTSRINEKEVVAVGKVLAYLKNSHGFDEFQKHWNNIADPDKRLQEQEVGIISFYGKQVGRLNKDIRPVARKLGIPVRIRSVDKFQGMERNIVIVSTVRSNKLELASGRIAENADIGFARAPERLNVALSRARRLLVVVGNKDFFYQFKDRNGNRIYKNAIDTIAQNGKIIPFKDLEKY